MYHAVPVFRSPIGNMDALSFLNSAIVVYVEIRVSGGDARRTGKRWKRHGEHTHVKGPEDISPGLLQHWVVRKAGC